MRVAQVRIRCDVSKVNVGNKYSKDFIVQVIHQELVLLYVIVLEVITEGSKNLRQAVFGFSSTMMTYYLLLNTYKNMRRNFWC